MAELIDRVAFRDFWNKNYRHQYANDTFLIAIANFPTVDAVPVVRCKDCKHYKPMKPYPSYNGRTNYCCRSASTRVNDDDFCSYGERKEHGQA